jgi:hypothetical protein
MRRNVNYNTPLPKEVPQAPNPPAANVDYWLATHPSGEVAINVLDRRGNVIRHLSSALAAPVREAARAPMEQFWLAPSRALTTNVGLNRATWDLRYDPPPAFTHAFDLNGNPGATPPSPEGRAIVVPEAAVAWLWSHRLKAHHAKLPKQKRKPVGQLGFLLRDT